MDLKKYMIIIDEEIVTNNISYFKFNNIKKVFAVRFKGSNRFYHYNFSRLKFLTNPKLIDLNRYTLYVGNELLRGIKEVYDFNYFLDHYYHIVFENNRFKDYVGKEIRIVNKENCYVIDYMKDVADVVSIEGPDGQKLLSKQIDKVLVDCLDTALANYLKLSNELGKSNNMETLIFPFGCNSSQYFAVKNAIYNKISVVEGPPGTGKTQTILNIIANIIVRDMNCQIVSFNNTAIENIQDKLKNKYNLDFFVALLGKKKNKDLFIEMQDESIPNFDEYEKVDMNEIAAKLKSTEVIVSQYYEAKKELSRLIQKKYDLELEYKYFKALVESQKIELVELKRYDINKVKLLWNELLSLKEITFWHKLKFIYIYKTGDFSFYNNDLNIIIKTIQNIIYKSDINELEKAIIENENYIYLNEKTEEEFIEYSMDYFKKYLSIKYKEGRKKYSSSDIWKNSNGFLNDYPVVLSTTYSSRNSLNNELKFDYIIMDEASQIDVVTGTLALSSAKYAVVIGDEKQLTNVIKPETAEIVNKIFCKYNIDKSYSYTLNNFLESIKNTIPIIQKQLLVEHYRCHPKIINFCNKKFYNNELVIMTKDNNEDDVIKIIRTNRGDHARGLSNQRQIDEIKKLLRTINDKDIGIIAPYNEQVNLIKENINGIEVNTIHKYQGREKDVIIISTVENDIGDFVGDSRLLNVAVSRAIRQLFMIITGNEIKNQNIVDFINYVRYNNMEIVDSKIYSSFDLLYKQYELERLNFFKKHNRITKFDSENIIYYLIVNIIKDYNNLQFHFHQSLNDLIKDKSLLNDIERRYVSHHNTHLDFYIFNIIGDVPVLAIEVDGYKYHKKGSKQYDRDLLKNEILNKYNIPLVRLKTNGSEEEKVIRDKLDEILR